MRKHAIKAYEEKGYLKIWHRGWRKGAKKVLASVLAGAMVLTGGAVVPQNTAVAEAAETIATVGTDNGDDTYTANWWIYSEGYSQVMPEGDFSYSFSFQQKVTASNDWAGFWVGLTPTIPVGNEDAGGLDWSFRSDGWTNHSFTGSSVGECTRSGEWSTTKQDADVAVSVERIGTTITISTAQTNENGTYTNNVVATNCPTGQLAVCLTGEACLLTVNSAVVLPRHTLTMNCVDSEGNSLGTETTELLEGRSYSIAPPEIDGYTPDVETITGTMGTADDEVTVKYWPAETHTVTVNYETVTGVKVAESQTIEVDSGKTYSIESPSVAGYIPSPATVTGTMGLEDEEITVTYKSYIATISGQWNSIPAGYSVQKIGDFDISFSFHNESIGGQNWDNYGISLSKNLSTEWADGWFLRADRYSNLTFTGGPDDFWVEGTGKTYTDNIDWGTFSETLKDSEVTVGVSRKGSTITVTNHVVGANGVVIDWSATDTNCPTDNLLITLTGDNSKLYLYDAPVSDTMVEPTVTDAIAVIGSGSFDLAWNDYDKFYNSAAPSNDFTVTYKFHNSSAGELNWSNYAVVLKDEAGNVWHQRADCWALSQDVDAAIFGKGAPVYSGVPTDWDAFRAAIKDSDVTVTVVREGTTITIYNQIEGANGDKISWSASATDCTTDAITVMLGGEGCMLKLASADVTDKASDAPIDTPSAEPTETPDVPSEPTEAPAEPTQTPDTPATDAPTEEPTETPDTPATKAPAVSNGDKVVSSSVTYKVTSTKSKTVSYQAVKNASTKKNITVPATIKVTTGGKKVTYKVTAVSKNAFANAKKLQKVTIGKNVKKIDANAFKNCSKLTTIVITSKNLTSVGKNALKGTSKKLVIKVPKGKAASYKKLFKGKGNSSVVVK